MNAPPQNAEEARRAALELLRNIVSADLYVVHTMLDLDGAWVTGPVSAWGNPVELVQFWEGRAGTRPGDWDPRNPEPDQVNQFVSAIEGLEALGIEPTSVRTYREHYAPFGLRYDQRALLYEGECFVAYVSLMRREQPFGPGARARLQHLVAPLQDLLQPVRTYDIDKEPVFVLCGTRGEIEGMSESLVDTVSAATLARISQATLAMGAMSEVPVVPLDEWALTPLRLTGGRVGRVLWRGRPVRSVCRNPLSKLTSRQLEVTELVAGGLSAPDAARKLDIGVETVRDHLKQAYRRLGVTNRAELARLVAEAQLRD